MCYELKQKKVLVKNVSAAHNMNLSLKGQLVSGGVELLLNWKQGLSGFYSL